MADNERKPGTAVQKNGKQQQRRGRSNAHKLVKRPPAKLEQGPNVIYVTSTSNVKALLTRCGKLIETGCNDISIYALGAAIKRGILLALQITEEYPLYQLSAQTFTTELTDDLEPATDAVDYEIQHRQNSAVHIALTRRA